MHVKVNYVIISIFIFEFNMFLLEIQFSIVFIRIFILALFLIAKYETIRYELTNFGILI